MKAGPLAESQRKGTAEFQSPLSAVSGARPSSPFLPFLRFTVRHFIEGAVHFLRFGLSSLVMQLEDFGEM